MSTNIRSITEPVLWLPESNWTLIPEGQYELKYKRHSYFKAFGQKFKLGIEFQVIDLGHHFATAVTRFYNVIKQGRNYRVPKNGDLNREFVQLYGKNSVRRGMDWARLSKHIVLGRVRTVNRNANQKSLSEDTQYSVVSELIRIVS